MEMTVSFYLPDHADRDAVIAIADELVDLIAACTKAMGVASTTAVKFSYAAPLAAPPTPAAASLPGGVIRVPFLGRIT